MAVPAEGLGARRPLLCDCPSHQALEEVPTRGGDAFEGGFNKAALAALDDQHLRTHVRDTRRAELAHWLIILVGPLFLAGNRWQDVVAMQVLAVGLSIPCIAAQRYNRIRLQRVLSRRGAKGP